MAAQVHLNVMDTATPQGSHPAGSPASAALPASYQHKAVAPLTPLQTRQWQRAAQRSVRLALTTFKTSRSRIEEMTSQGLTAATQLTNTILTAKYLPDMQLPTSLQPVQGITDAAVNKLRRRQHRLLNDLEGTVQQVSTAVASMESALRAVKENFHQVKQIDTEVAGGHKAGILSPVPLGHTSTNCLSAIAAADSKEQQSDVDSTPTAVEAAAGASSAGQGVTTPCIQVPVFHMLSLPEIVSKLQHVLDMHAQDLLLKQQVSLHYAAAISAAAASRSQSPAAADSSSAASRGSAGQHADANLKKQLTVLLTCWMTQPYIQEDEAVQILQLLTDEMVGF